MIKRSDIFSVAIFILLILVLYINTCNSDKNIQNTTIVKTEYIYDTIVKQLPILIPKEKVVVVPDIDTMFIPYYDTTFCKQLAEEYFSTRYYNDTIENDSISVYYNTSVSNNKLNKIYSSYKIKFPVTVNNTIEENRIKFYIGGNVGTDIQHFYTGIHLMLIDKRDISYHIGAAFSPTGAKPMYQVGVGYKLSFRKLKKK